jgi:enoyl-CoA hydratase/carnithine racemase
VLGGGLELALAFTIRIASTDLKAGFPEVKLGVFPGLGGTQRLPRLVGEGRALELMLSGRIIDAPEALRIGLVTETVEREALEGRAMELARSLAAGPPLAMRAIIEATRRASDLGRAEGLDYERRLFGVICGTEDKTEGTQAWLEKRPPSFRGR